jgi:hypothetical protein
MYFEILNFGVGGHTPIKRLMELERKAFAFQPDAVMYFAQIANSGADAQKIAQSMETRTAPPYPFVRDLLSRAGIHEGASEAEVWLRMRQYQSLLDQGVLDQLERDCRDHNLLLLWVQLPTLGPQGVAIRNPHPPQSSPGMITISVEGVFDGQDLKRLIIAPWDFHPNATGHRMIADQLYAELLKAPGAELLRPDSVAMKFAAQSSTAGLDDDVNKK